MSSVNPNAQHDGKDVNTRETGMLRVHVDQDPEKDGLFLMHKVPEDDLNAKLCVCPTCFNTFSLLCVESGDKCVPVELKPGGDGVNAFIFCRNGNDKNSVGGDSGGNEINILSQARPQLYTPDEVKEYYPFWQSLLSQGWDGVTDLWLEFQGYFTTQSVWDPSTGQYVQIEVWVGPPAKGQVERVEYEVSNAVDFIMDDDRKPVHLWNEDITGCHGPEYVMEGNNVCATSPPSRVLRHPQVGCNTMDCQCNMTRGEYKQWRKDNSREHPYWYIRAKSYTTGCTPDYQYINGVNTPYRYYTRRLNVTFNLAITNNGSGTLTVQFNPTGTHGVTIQPVVFNNLTDGEFLQTIVASYVDVTGTVKVNITDGQGTVTVKFTACNLCNTARGEEYEHVESFVLNTYKYVSIPYDCAKCKGESNAIGISNWCYGEALPQDLRPAGLYTECMTWDAYNRCTYGNVNKERLYKCCEVPPNIIGWFVNVRQAMQQDGVTHAPARWVSMIAGYNEYAGRWDSPFTLSILWDNNTTSGLSLNTTSFAHIWDADGEPVFGASPESTGYITKCCNRYYWKLKVEPGPVAWLNWPVSISGGSGRFGYLESIKVHLWMSTPVVKDDVGVYQDPEENDYFKVIEQLLEWIPDNYGGTFCTWDRETNTCTGFCSNVSTSHVCGPFQYVFGSGSPSNIATMSGSYGSKCYISQNTSNPNTSPQENRTFLWGTQGIPYRRYFCTEYAQAVDVPTCYYKDCLFGMGDGTNSPASVLLAESQTPQTIPVMESLGDPPEWGSQEWKNPRWHGGFCQWSEDVPHTGFCHSCNHVFIQCRNPDMKQLDTFHTKTPYRPRFCGYGKCQYFKMKGTP